MRRAVCCFVCLVLAATASATVPWPLTPDWRSAETSLYGTGCDFGDVDLDGYLDLAVSNGNDMLQAPNLVYHSDAGVLPVAATWTSSDARYSGHCAFGDLDGDGYPELMVANYITPGWGPGWAQIYANAAGVLSTSPTWESPHTVHTFRAAFGDPDGDGDLDLAVATGEEYNHYVEPTLIFFNEGGTLQSSPGWTSADVDAAYDIAFVDIDGDGDQDLAVCEGTPQGHVKIYFNQDGVLDTSPGWSATHQGSGNSFDLGDLDGDGDPDLAVHYNDQLGGDGRAAIYWNEGGQLATEPGWASDFDGYGSAITAVDVDGDGRQDVVAGSWWGTVRVYLNTGAAFATAPDWQTDPAHASVVEGFAFGDLDEGATRTDVVTFAAGQGPCLELPHRQLQRIVAVAVGGVDLPATDWCTQPGKGWISVRRDLLTAPVEVTYAWSPALDLAVSNWDDATYVFHNSDIVPVVDATPDARVLADVRAFPNPFNPATAIAFSLAAAADVRVQVFDVAGREVARLGEGRLASGAHALVWQPQGLASGVYLYRVQAGGEVAGGRVMLVK